MMHLLRQGWNRVRAFFLKKPLDAELSEEMATHLEFAVEENMARGLSPQEARRQAMIRFGNLGQAEERHREARGLPAMDILMQDLRFTFRSLRRDWSFALIAVGILALGIGANVAVFSVVNTILLRPLPFVEPDRLLWMGPAPSKCGFSCETYSADAYDEFREQNHAFSDVAGYYAFSSSGNHKLSGRGQPQPATGIDVTGNFFQTLGVQPRLGRLFTPEELHSGSRPVLLLTNAYWRTQFHGDPAIVGKAIGIDGATATVVGVLPESFDFGAVFQPGAKIDLFEPAILDDIRPQGNTLALIGRLKPGVTLSQAQADANLVVPQLYWGAKYPDSKGSYKPMALKPLKQHVSGMLRESLILLWCAVGTILLIVCVNLSNLLLARAAARGKEFALRSALGAGRMRIARQLLTESLLLSLSGAVLGLAIAFAITFFVAHQGSVALPLLGSVRVDGAALLWTLLVAVVAACLFGIVPGWKIAGGNLHEGLKDSGHGMSASRGHERLRTLLVISEVALACVLLVAAGLLLRSFLRVTELDLGFEPSRAAAISVDYDDGGGKDAGLRRSAIYQQILAKVAAIPGVESAGFTDYLPLERNRAWGPIGVPGRTYKPGEQPSPLVYVISPGYLKALGAQLKGRDFAWSDGPASAPVIILNEVAARSLWPGEDAVGRMADAGGQPVRVVGVIRDIHTDGVEGQPGWQVYYSAMQQGPNGAQLVVRSQMSPSRLAGPVMQALRELNPGQAAAEFRPIQTIVDRAVSPRKFFVLLVVSFAALGMILASLGIYGVISYSVTQQTKEIGIRMALGASASGVQRGVLLSTLRMTLIGIAAGVVVSLALSRAIASMLFATEPNDPATFLVMVLLLGAVALVAGFIPARRASRIDPMVALRNS